MVSKLPQDVNYDGTNLVLKCKIKTLNVLSFTLPMQFNSYFR